MKSGSSQNASQLENPFAQIRSGHVSSLLHKSTERFVANILLNAVLTGARVGGKSSDFPGRKRATVHQMVRSSPLGLSLRSINTKRSFSVPHWLNVKSTADEQSCLLRKTFLTSSLPLGCGAELGTDKVNPSIWIEDIQPVVGVARLIFVCRRRTCMHLIPAPKVQVCISLRKARGHGLSTLTFLHLITTFLYLLSFMYRAPLNVCWTAAEGVIWDMSAI